MKKVFNLSIILAVLAAFTLTSCNPEEEDAATVTITLDKTTLSEGEALTGKIISDNNLKEVTILKDGSTLADYPTTDFGTGKPISGKDGSYIIRIDGLLAGSYTIRATDKNGKEANKSFTVEFDWTSGVNTISENGAYYYKQGTTTGTLVVSELTEASVKVALNGKAAVTLSDAGTSYLLKDGTASNQAGVNASNFLLAKKSAVATIVDKDGLSTAIEGAEGVLFVKQ
jgi:hypothetical protein